MDLYTFEENQNLIKLAIYVYLFFRNIILNHN